MYCSFRTTIIRESREARNPHSRYRLDERALVRRGYATRSPPPVAARCRLILLGPDIHARRVVTRRVAGGFDQELIFTQNCSVTVPFGGSTAVAAEVAATTPVKPVA